MRLLILVFSSLHTFASTEVEDLCIKYSLSFLEGSSTERTKTVEKVKKIISTQNAYCPGSVESVIFVRDHNEKSKLNLYSQMVENSLLNLENIAGQVWSEEEFKKIALKQENSFSKLKTQKKEINF